MQMLMTNVIQSKNENLRDIPINWHFEIISTIIIVGNPILCT